MMKQKTRIATLIDSKNDICLLKELTSQDLKTRRNFCNMIYNASTAQKVKLNTSTHQQTLQNKRQIYNKCWIKLQLFYQYYSNLWFFPFCIQMRNVATNKEIVGLTDTTALKIPIIDLLLMVFLLCRQ